MKFHRRSVLAGASACLVLRALPAAAASGTRVFHIFRAGDRIGEQTLRVTRDGDRAEVAIDVDIAVKLLGVTAYRYRLSSREDWVGGRLRRLEANSNENGERHFAMATEGADGLEVDGSAFSGTVGGRPGTTTYWARPLLERETWISTRDGRPLAISARAAGREQIPTGDGPVAAQRWNIRGDIDLALFYDEAGEWVGNRFDARGETARFELAQRGAALAPLWPG